MYCRNFFKFAFVCSAFQMLCGGLSVIALSDNSDTKIVDPQYIESKESKDSVVGKSEALEIIDSDEKNSDDDENLVEISMLPNGQLVKEIKIQIYLEGSENAEKSVDFKDFENTESKSSVDSVNSKPLNGLDESLVQVMKNRIQERKNAIVSMLGALRDSLNRTYRQGDSKEKSLLDFLKSCELTMKIVTDATDSNQKTLQMDLKSPAPVNDTILLEKTSLDEKNNRFIEINLKNC